MHSPMKHLLPLFLLGLGIASAQSQPDESPGWVRQASRPVTLQEFKSRLASVLRPSAASRKLNASAQASQIQLLLPAHDFTALNEAAAGLEGDPAALFALVHRTCRHSPGFGLNKGPLRTFYDKSGNDLDLAVLLAAFLDDRQRCPTASDVQINLGTMTLPLSRASSWLRVPESLVSEQLRKASIFHTLLENNSISIARFWVTATIAGATRTLDPALRFHVRTPGRLSLTQLRSASGFDLNALKSAAATSYLGVNEIRSMNVASLKSHLDTLRDNLLGNSEFTNRLHGAGSLLPGWSRVEEEDPFAPPSLPEVPADVSYSTWTYSDSSPARWSWQSTPDEFKTQMELSHPEWDVNGRGLIISTADIAECQLSLKTTPASPVPGGVWIGSSDLSPVTSGTVSAIGHQFGVVQLRAGYQPVGVKHECALINSGSDDYTIVSVTLSSADMFTLPEQPPLFSWGTLHAGGTRHIEVIYTPTTVAQHSGRVLVTLRNKRTSGSSSLSFTLKGIGHDVGLTELLVDGMVRAQGRAEQVIPDLRRSSLRLKIIGPTAIQTQAETSHTYQLLRSGTYVIPMDFGDTDNGGFLTAIGRQLTRLKKLPEGDAKEAAILRATLQMMGVSWFQQTNQSEQFVQNIFQDGHASGDVTLHRVGIVAQEFDTQTKAASGFYVDVANQLVRSAQVTPQSNASFTALGFLNSAQEHGVLEQMQPGTMAASTTRMIEKALLATTSKPTILLLNRVNAASFRSKLSNYESATVDSWINELQGHAGSWLLLPSDGKVALTTASRDWKGYGAVRRLYGLGQTANDSTIGMLISGGYNGGYSGTQAQVSPDTSHQYVATQQQLNQATPPQPSSKEPINLVTGEYYYDRTDVTIGQAFPLGVGFARHYSSAQADAPGVLGHGWSHNWESGVELMTDTGLAFGSRHAMDSSTAYVATMVLRELCTEENVTHMTLSALVANWCVDALRNNVAKVYVGNKTLFFSNHSNGRGDRGKAFYPPPGVTDQLLWKGAASDKEHYNFDLVSRDRSITEFRLTGSGTSARSALSRLVNPDGLAVSLTYTTSKGIRVVDSIKDANGRGFNLDYNTDGLLIKLTTVGDSTARTVTFQYDNPKTTQNLVRIIDPAQRFTTHHYASPDSHLMTELRDGRGRIIASNEYDSLGRAIRQRAYGHSDKLWSYFFSDLRTVEQDPLGGRTTYDFDDQKRTIGQRDQSGYLRRTVYDFNNFPVQVTDAEGRVTTTLYDRHLRPTRITHPDNTYTTQAYDDDHRPTQSISRSGRVTLLEYDAVASAANIRFRPSREKVTDPATNITRTTSYTYGTRGREIGQVTLITDPAGKSTSLSYDLRGAPASVSSDRVIYNEINARYQLISPSLFSTYDARGDLVQTINEHGIKTVTTYNANRQPISVTQAAETDQAYTVTTLYDAAGDAVQSYDSMPLAFRSGQTFSAQGKPLRTFRITPDGTFDSTLQGNNFASEQLYDSRDWPVGSTFLSPSLIPWQRVSTSTVLHPNGRPFQSTDPLGRTLTFASSPEQTTFSATDAAGYRVITSTDVIARRKLVSDAFPSTPGSDPLAIPSDVLKLDHLLQPEGELKSLTNRRGLTYAMVYDGFGQLKTRTTPGSRSTRYNYALDGNLANLTRPDNSTVTYDYFPRTGQLQTQTDSIGQIEHRYDLSGNLTRIQDKASGSTLTSTFDTQGRPNSFTDALGRKTSYTRLPNGLLRSVRYHAERPVMFPARIHAVISGGSILRLSVEPGQGYTSPPRIVFSPPDSPGGTQATAVADIKDSSISSLRITNPGTGYLTTPTVTVEQPPPDHLITYDYNADRSLAKITDWTGRSTTFRYYQDGRLHSIQRPNGSTRSFTYTAAGELALVAEASPGDPAHPVIHLTRYAYNQRGMVSQRSTFPGKPASASRSAPMTATAGPDNQLLTVNGAAQTYDLRGNLRKGVLPSGTMGSLAETYTFDARNRLTAMEGGHSFAYDVANNRIGITSGTSTTDFYLSPLGGLSQVVSEKTTTVGSDAASYERFFIYTPQGQLLYHLDPDMAGPISSTTRFKASHYHYDLTGSTVALSGDDGRVKGRVFYTPYGEITHRDAAMDTRFLFCGAYGVQTDKSGLVYMRARYYHPYLARFLNEDPIEFEGGMNWYAYALCDPISRIDPSGLWSPEAHDKIIDVSLAYRSVGNTFYNFVNMGDRRALMQASRNFDVVSQSSIFSNMHYMRSGTQTPAEAVSGMMKRVAGRMIDARSAAERGDKKTALKLLGEAMHPIMDMDSPMHREANGSPKVWRGYQDAVETSLHPSYGFSENGDVIEAKLHSPIDSIGNETTKHITESIFRSQNEYLENMFTSVFYGTSFWPEGRPTPK